MSDISSMIEVFKMKEINPKSRAEIIIQLGRLINDSFGANVTEPLVYQLVALLDSENRILNDEFYLTAFKKSVGAKS